MMILSCRAWAGNVVGGRGERGMRRAFRMPLWRAQRRWLLLLLRVIGRRRRRGIRC
jgi:hypothetical protein